MKVRNALVMISSLIALGCIVLTFTVYWAFIVPAVLIVFMNQRLLELGKK